MSAETKNYGSELRDVASSDYVSLKSLRNVESSSDRNEYYHQKHYASGWKILPDLLVNLLAGSPCSQEYTMRKYGMHQGKIKVILYSQGEYSPQVGSSGSLEVAYMVEAVRQFLSKSNLKDFFSLQNPSQARVIHELFTSFMDGKKEESCQYDQDSSICYSVSNSDVKIKWNGVQTIEGSKTLELVRLFFQSICLSDLFGKLKCLN